ncbi:cytochrome C biogenesis protein [Natrialbaceae archaeon A-gly3]
MTGLELATPLTVALSAALATFFSPCAYPLLPGYVGYYASQTEGERASLGGSLLRGAVAGVGVLVVFGVLIGLSFWVGHSAVSNLTVLEPVVGLLLIAFGVLVVVDRAPSISVTLPKRRSSVLGFGIFGAGYALAAAGCAAPFFIAVIARALSLSTGAGALVVGTYAVTVALLMIAVTVATGMGLVASAGRFVAHSKTIKRVAGVVMILAGMGQLYVAAFLSAEALL